MDESHKNNIEGKRLGTKIYELYTCDFKFFYTYYTSLEKVFLNWVAHKLQLEYFNNSG